MSKWVSAYERQPSKQGVYFAKCNGEKKLVYLFEFSKEMSRHETFLWLDESDEIKEIIDKLCTIDNIDDFCRFDRKELSEHFLTPYTPMIPKSILINTFHKYYLRIIAKLRVEISVLSKAQKNGLPSMIKENGVSNNIKPVYTESLLDKFLKDNKFF